MARCEAELDLQGKLGGLQGSEGRADEVVVLGGRTHELASGRGEQLLYWLGRSGRARPGVSETGEILRRQAVEQAGSGVDVGMDHDADCRTRFCRRRWNSPAEARAARNDRPPAASADNVPAVSRLGVGRPRCCGRIDDLVPARMTALVE